MTTFSWLNGLSPSSFEWGIEKSTVQFTAPLTKQGQAIDLYAYQWKVVIALPPRAVVDNGDVEAWVNSLVGGADTVTLYHRARPVPIGTMRGSPTVSGAHAQFANVLNVAGAWDTSRLNRFIYSEQLRNWLNLTHGIYVTDNTSIAPDGAMTADRLVDDQSTDSHYVDRYSTLGDAGAKVMSVYIKKDRLAGLIGMFSATQSHLAWFNPINGLATVLTPLTGATAGMIDMGGGWWRCWLKASFADTSSPIQRVGLCAFNGSVSYVGRGMSIRTNSALWSQRFDNWSPSFGGGGSLPVITVNYATAPDGMATATRAKFAKTSTSGNDYSIIEATLTSTGPCIRSVWMKSNTGTVQYVLIRDESSGLYKELAVTTAWQRFIVSASGSYFQIGLRRGVSTVDPSSADVLLWQAQQEIGATTAGPTILTTTAAVTTAADYVLKTNLNIRSRDFGVWATGGALINSGPTAEYLDPFFGVNANKLFADGSGGGHYATIGATSSDGTHTLSVYVKRAELSWAAVEMASSGAFVNLTNGAVGQVYGGALVAVTAEPNGFYRIAITAFAQASIQPIIYLAPSDGVASFSSTYGQGIYLYGAQLQTGIAATPLITTAGSPVTETEPAGLPVWGLQLEDDRLTDYIPTTTASRLGSGTLKGGDMIGVGSQLLQVASGGCVADASGNMAVPLVNRLRASVSDGVPVVWNKPTAEFYMVDTRSRSTYTPGQALSQGFELAERVT